MSHSLCHHYTFVAVTVAALTAVLAVAVASPGGVAHHEVLLPHGLRHDGLPEPGVAEAHEGEEKHAGEGVEDGEDGVKVGELDVGEPDEGGVGEPPRGRVDEDHDDQALEGAISRLIDR